MPGCTALNCTNSSKKGYKVYHFPTDEERCLQWVQNLGRGESWVPTKHTCVCEVHFEESQFESHRADGLKKLRPFAIPTIFDVKLNVHSPIRPKEIHRMKRGRPSLKEHLISEDSSVETNDKVKPTKRGRGRPLGSSNKRGKLPLKLAPKISIRKTKIQERLLDETVDMESFCDDVSNINVDVISCIENGDKCFLCGKVSPSSSDTQVATPTYTNNIPMLKRLERLALSEGLDLSLAPNGVLCLRCSHILNFLDRAEMECSMLNKTIAMCLVKMRDRSSKEQTEGVNLISGFLVMGRLKLN
uniref:THAP-type domain-containing protein n=1 Tax=Timema monikensis TaxID=170555 RepID=A0A7R9HID4_9NEOP|nr:unnamed protein product [Timema monikensis]